MSDIIPVIIIAKNSEDAAEFNGLCKRAGRLMRSYMKFGDAMDKIDEDAPDFLQKMGPHFEKFTMELMSIYPDYRVFERDAEGFSHLQTKTLEEFKKDHDL